jgi:Ca-activated chloride channel family protein
MNASFRWGVMASFVLSLTVGSLALAAGTAPEAKNDPAVDPVTAAAREVTQGALRIVDKDGGVVECPLKHTDVVADVSGFIARVRVTQTFHNPTKEKIEAVYVFPLPHEAAVDEMTMVLGERKIVGLIKRRLEARQIYEAALAAGQTAALLEQERPNIFTQSVGNIEPGQEVKIEIAYVDVLKYDLGSYEFRFPMVVGPRYIPGTPSGAAPPTPAELQGRVSPPVADTDRVPDASRISPPVLKPGMRNGHDISLAIKLNAGVPIQNLVHPNHQAAIQKDGQREATIALAKGDSIPNKDFVLRYDVVGKKPEMAVLGHTGEYSGDRQKLGSGYFMLMIQPQEDERLTKSPPREIVFLCDVSGSMSGQPTGKVIEAMRGMLKLCRPQDTVQVISFASQANKLFEKPVPVNEANIAKALAFSEGFQGSGGTEMLTGVKLAIDEPLDKERVRIVVMLTDGYIGNEAEIIEHVGKHCGDQVRFWTVGIGSSPNMFLIDGVAKQGGGMGKSLGLEDDTVSLTQEIMTRIQRAQLAKVKIDWGELQVAETYPAKIPELWAGRPVIVFGRYSTDGPRNESALVSEIKISGNVEGEDVSWPLSVELPLEQKEHDVLAKVWARQKIEDLMQQTYYHGSPAIEEMVTGIALDYKLMSQYTSFVAVDSTKAVDEAAPPAMPRRMLVPVPLPEGTRWEGFFGEERGESREGFAFDASRIWSAPQPMASRPLALARDRAPGESKNRSELSFRFAVPMNGPAPTSQPMVSRLYSNSGITQFGRQSGMQMAGGGSGGFGGRGGAMSGRGIATKQASLAAGFGSIAPASPTITAGTTFVIDGLHLMLKDGEIDGRAGGGSALNYTHSALYAQSGKLTEAAQKAWAAATGEQAPKDRQALRQLLTQAALFDSAAASFGQSDGSTAANAIQRLDTLHAEDVKEWTAKLPQLSQKLDLVIRNQSLTSALEKVAEAAGIAIVVDDASLGDAAVLAAGGLPSAAAPRVNYLDLRRATVAQALDWLLMPEHLSWSPDGGKIVARSGRREAGSSAWIYHVGAIALPSGAELAPAAGDQAKLIAAAQQAADAFAGGLRGAMKIDESQLVWFAPGELLLVGTPEQHAKLSSLVATLQAKSGAPVAAGSGLPAELVKATRERFAVRQEKLAKAEAASRKLELAAIHDHFSWQLVAAAAGGETDLEALTELQIAWNAPETRELLAGPARPLVMRSLWAICEAVRQLEIKSDKASGLARLAGSARQQVAETAVAKPAEGSDPATVEAAVLASNLLAVLASPDDTTARDKLAPLIAPRKAEDSLAELRMLARLIVPAPAPGNQELAAADRAALGKLLAAGIAANADHALLIALASREAGSDTWTAFRSAAADLLGKAPLPGELVVWVNRLGPAR